VTDSGTAVFLSYASQDVEAASRICEALRAAGIEVWLDRSELRGGDAWDQRIRREIRDCALFVPLISANTVARAEGYFRLEWSLAEARSHMIARNKAFIVPVCLDQTPEAGADVPESFQRVQWTRLPAGDTSPAFTARITALLSAPGPLASLQGSIHHGTATGPMGPVALAASTTAKSRPQRWRLKIFVIVVMGLGLAYFTAGKQWFANPGVAQQPIVAVASVAPPFNPPPHSLAVLPFVNMSGDPNQEYFSDGISEELLDALSRLNQLHVVASTSAFSFKNQNVDTSEIARKLNVGAILEGSVRRSGNTARITVQLIDAMTGYRVWSQTYDRSLTDILKVQTEVATSVAAQLKIKLVGDESARLGLGGTQNSMAYDAYLHGAQLFARLNQRYEPADRRAALAAIDQAIALDPNFAAAYVLRANALSRFTNDTNDLDQRAVGRARATRAAERAVMLAPDFGEAHLALAGIRTRQWLDFAHAAAEYDKALALAPGNADVQAGVSGFAALTGHADAAITAARRAVSFDPQNNVSYLTLATAFYFSRRYGEEQAALQVADALAPSSVVVKYLKSLMLVASGQFEQARLLCEPQADSDSASRDSRCLAYVYHALGRAADAERELKQFQAEDGKAFAYEYAKIYAQWRNVPEALRWLRIAEDLRDDGLCFIKVDWELDPVRQEPAFKEIEAKLNFPP
jgi:TolB-like protein